MLSLRETPVGVRRAKNRTENVQHRWTYIVGLWLVVLGVLYTLGHSAVVFASEEETVVLESSVGSLSPQDEELGRLIMHSLSSDRLPSTYAQPSGRLILPVMRGNAPLYVTFGETARIGALGSLRRQHVQQNRVARIRSVQDKAGYYVFALRKIII